MLFPGIAFGSGEHPTTRLCLKAIDHILFEYPGKRPKETDTAADIGTGTGVLALALCLAGVSECLAYEIDPVSIHEARRNIGLNGLDPKIRLVEGYLEAGSERFSIICANLRYPSLARLAGTLHSALTSKGALILSGIREWEKADLLKDFPEHLYERVWQEDEKKWSGAALIKK